jgi:hypothetical protein
VGSVRLRVTLSSPAVLIQSAAATGASYTLSNIYFSCDVIDLDPSFHQMQASYLQSGGNLEINYNNWFSFSSTGGLGQSTRFSLSSQSINRVWGCFTTGANYPIASIGSVANTASGSYFDPISGTSSVFTRPNGGAAGVVVTYGNGTNSTPVTYTCTGSQFQLNSSYYPNFLVPAESAFALMVNSYGLSQNTDGGCSPLLNSLTKYLGSFWVAEQRFDHGEGASVISGLDTRGTNCAGQWTTQGSITVGSATGSGAASYPGANLIANVFVQTTSTLVVAAGRQITVIL